MSSTSSTTRDHEAIKKWAEERSGKPSHVKATGSNEDIGILRIDFPGYSGEDSLEPISWEQWFEKFDDRSLSFLYQEETSDGQKSNFNRLVSAETAAEANKPSGPKRATKKAAPIGRATVKTVAKKSVTAVKKVAPGGKAAVKKAVAKKSVTKTAPLAKKTAVKTPLKKTAAKKTAAKKIASKKAPAKKAVKKFGAAKKSAPVKKSLPVKKTAKKSSKRR